jgi:hypothetical protein
VSTISVGGDVKLSERLLIGGAFGYTENKGDFGGGRGGYKLREDDRHVLRGLRRGQLVPRRAPRRRQPRLSRHPPQHRPRRGDAQEETAETSGYHYYGSLVGGWWYGTSTLLHGPYAKLTYQEAHVRQFSEQSQLSTALAYGAQKREALQTSLGWQVAANMGAIRPWGRVSWEYDAKADDRSGRRDAGLARRDLHGRRVPPRRQLHPVQRRREHGFPGLHGVPERRRDGEQGRRRLLRDHAGREDPAAMTVRG